VTRYEFFRKRIAPVLFLGMVGLIAFDTCKKQERHHSTIVIDLGVAEARVKSIEADLIVENEPIGHFERRALSETRIGCPCRFETAMPKEDGTLKLTVELEGGERRMLTRHVRAIEGGTVTLQLASDLQ
jgi:hypothetical protein